MVSLCNSKIPTGSHYRDIPHVVNNGTCLRKKITARRIHSSATAIPWELFRDAAEGRGKELESDARIKQSIL